MKRSALYKNIPRIFIFLNFILVVSQSGCKKEDNYPDIYKYEIPDQLDDGWKTESLSDAGIDEKILYNLMNRICATSGSFFLIKVPGTTNRLYLRHGVPCQPPNTLIRMTIQTIMTGRMGMDFNGGRRIIPLAGKHTTLFLHQAGEDSLLW